MNMVNVALCPRVIIFHPLPSTVGVLFRRGDDKVDFKNNKRPDNFRLQVLTMRVCDLCYLSVYQSKV